MDERKRTCETPWPPSDNKVGVVLVAHSMGYVSSSDYSSRRSSVSLKTNARARR